MQSDSDIFLNNSHEDYSADSTVTRKQTYKTISINLGGQVLWFILTTNLTESSIIQGINI